MGWIQSLSNAIDYIEANLMNDIGVDDVANHAYTSGSHFQFIFHVVTGITIGEYIRNRRLSVAAKELLNSGASIIDVAMRCQYDTQESFSKAFTRFHGVPPSRVTRLNAKAFNPMRIDITIRGGFDMSFNNEFHLIDFSQIEGQTGEKLSDAEKYAKIVNWAAKARGRNPLTFDALTEWILSDAEWTPDKLAENEQILLRGVFARFKQQNARLRACLNALKPSGVVNNAAFKALDRFDAELNGEMYDVELRDIVKRVFADFSLMSGRAIREKFAGNKTGSSGTDSVPYFGYINSLKETDAQVQWTLFMPDMVKRQQKGFKLESFEYIKLNALRFIGLESKPDDMPIRERVFGALDALKEYNSEFSHDILFMHHNGLGVDVGEWHGVWGRFMRAGTPVPEGFIHIDLVPDDDGKPGAPFVSQFAHAIFSGDMKALHEREGYDSDAMYDVTRNIILGQCVTIPYPNKYWTAEVFPDGYKQWSCAYLFGVIV